MIAGYHAQALSQIPGTRLVGVCGRDPARTEAFAAKVGAPVSTTQIESLVSRSDVDVVCVTTPSGSHMEPALAAIAHRKHVVVEKPLEVTLERADRIIAAADEARVHLCPIFQARFGDGAMAVKAAVEAGRLGTVALASAYVKWYRSPQYYQSEWKGTRALDGGGALMNQGIHAVDLLQWFAGMPSEVKGFTTRRVHAGIEVEDTASASLRFESGALGVLEASTAAWPGWSRRIEVCGETGSICLEDDRIVRWDFSKSEPGDEAIRAAKADTLGSGASAPNAIAVEGHRRQLHNLVEAITHGRALAIDGRQARNAVAIITAVYRSAEGSTGVRP